MNFDMNQVTEVYPFDSTLDATNDSYADFCALYQQRELEQRFVIQLNHLIKDVQLHRGVSMGLLAGNNKLEKDLDTLQRRINRRLSSLGAFSYYSGTLLCPDDKKNIQLAWDTIRHDWRDDKLVDNFELHSHFIEKLLLKILDITNNLKVLVWEDLYKNQGDSSYPRHMQQLELLNFICSLLPITIENMAKIRGIASFAAEVGNVQDDQKRKLRYFLQCARENNVKAHHCAHRLHEVLNGALSAKYAIGELETQFTHFIDLVNHDVLSGKDIQTSSWQLFGLGTTIIDKYWQIIDDGLNLLRIWHHEDLEAWIHL